MAVWRLAAASDVVFTVLFRPRRPSFVPAARGPCTVRKTTLSNVEFGYHVESALYVGMPASIKRKVVRFDPEKEVIVL